MSEAHPPPLHIVTAYPGPLAPHFMLAWMEQIWREAGHRVTVGPLARLEAGAGLMHVDSTRVDPATRPACAPGTVLLNGEVLDISKRRISGYLLAGPDDAWDGPVILKTDANYFGLPEATARPRGRLGRLGDRLRQRLPWRLARQLPAMDYPVLPHRRQVPGWVWERRDLVVERFLPEMDGSRYVLRMYLFFGERGVVYRMLSDQPVIKSANVTAFEAATGEPPPEIAAAKAALGVDFGKFDYVVRDGRALLLDVNKTPALSGKRMDRIRYLAGGLEGLMAARA